MPEEVYSLCFMCTGRCPIQVSVESGQVQFIKGNPHVPAMAGSLCSRGVAGKALVNDDQRLQSPLIRTGPRGSGQWRKTGWEEALDYAAQGLQKVIEKYGGKSIVLGERAQLSTHASKTLLKALGSPNYFSHDALCKGSINTACRSLFGYTDGQMNMDYSQARQLIFYGRNMFEAIVIKPLNQVMDALDNGAKLTYIDPRASVTATKAHRFWMIRPGTDLALNYALIHVLLKEKLYHTEFVQRWVTGLSKLEEFIQPYTPEWAEKETGIPAWEIEDFAREVSRDKPHVIFHFGYRGAHNKNEIHLRRSIMILNTLLGSIETPGGYFIRKGPGDAGGKPARKLTEQDLPKVEAQRFDKVGSKDFPLPDPNHGLGQMLPQAILNQDPYPLKALISYRFEPLMSIPDSKTTKQALDQLDMIITIDINHSDIAWHSDVILPESTYLERMDCVQQLNGPKPQMFLRQQCVPPRFDTWPGPMILKALADRLSIGRYFPYESMEELLRWQLEPTGYSLQDFQAKGFVSYTDKKIFWDRQNGLKFKTPSGKIELVSSLLEDAGFESFPAYQSPESPKEQNQFRLIVGRCAHHTHVSTQNNPYLNQLVPENEAWINSAKAAQIGIKNRDMVQISSSRGSGVIKAKVTDFIHPEAVFILHGFGHESALARRSFNKGVSDAMLQENITDPVGGSPALHDTFVQIRPAG